MISLPSCLLCPSQNIGSMIGQKRCFSAAPEFPRFFKCVLSICLFVYFSSFYHLWFSLHCSLASLPLSFYQYFSLLSVCVSVCLCMCVSHSLAPPLHLCLTLISSLSFCLSVCLSGSFSTCVFLSLSLNAFLSVCLSVCHPFCSLYLFSIKFFVLYFTIAYFSQVFSLTHSY